METRRPFLSHAFIALLVAAFAFLAASPAVHAATYTVEVLVFENAVGDGSDELWNPQIPGETPSAAAQPGDIAFVPLDGLAGEAASLKRSSAYRLLQSVAWKQPLTPRRGALVVPLGTRGVGTAAGTAGQLQRLTGTVRVYGDTYLYVDVDISYGAAGASTTSATRYSPTVRYRINERRRIKLNEVHYFDHPRFGALVQVRTVR